MYRYVARAPVFGMTMYIYIYIHMNIYGNGSKSHTPSEHPNPTTKIGSKMGGEFTYPMIPLVLTTTAIYLGEL